MLAFQLVSPRAGIITCLLIIAMPWYSGCVRGDEYCVTAPVAQNSTAIAPGNATTNQAGTYAVDAVYKYAGNDIFSTQLSFKMLSARWPRMAMADVNGDGLEDIFVCGDDGNKSALYLQVEHGIFKPSNTTIFSNNVAMNVDCAFFDADGDNDADLYVCSGHNALKPAPFQVFDCLYLNDGKGNFTLSAQQLPAASGLETHTCVAAADYDADGDIDVYIGVYTNADQYGYHPGGYLLQNDGNGVFTNVTEQSFAGLTLFGMITDARWFDYDKDGRPDLVLAGENMPVKIFHNTDGRLVEERMPGQQLNGGSWSRLVIKDINDDGYPDIIAANQEQGTHFTASVLLNDAKRGFALKHLQVETKLSPADTIAADAFDTGPASLKPGAKAFVPN